MLFPNFKGASPFFREASPVCRKVPSKSQGSYHKTSEKFPRYYRKLLTVVFGIFPQNFEESPLELKRKSSRPSGKFLWNFREVFSEFSPNFPGTSIKLSPNFRKAPPSELKKKKFSRLEEITLNIQENASGMSEKFPPNISEIPPPSPLNFKKPLNFRGSSSRNSGKFPSNFRRMYPELQRKFRRNWMKFAINIKKVTCELQRNPFQISEKFNSNFSQISPTIRNPEPQQSSEKFSQNFRESLLELHGGFICPLLENSFRTSRKFP